MYPHAAIIGANTGKVNTFTPVDIGNLTGGVFKANDLLDPKSCLAFFFFSSGTIINTMYTGTKQPS